MRILEHRVVVLLGIMLMVLGCGTPPDPLSEGEETSPRPAASPYERGNCRTLVEIDSLMWRQPDSAFALLIDFAASPQADSLDGFDEHYCQLLISELMYKNYCEQRNRTELLMAVGYFDSIADLHGANTRGVSVWPFQRRDAWHASAQTMAFLAARAHYINGVGLYERDSVAGACGEYIKALGIMEGRFDENELSESMIKFMALVYTRLADLYSDLYLHEQAIYFGKMSLEYYRKAESSPRHLARMLNEIGSQYEMTENLDSALHYYRKGIMLLQDTNSITYRDLAVHVAFLSYERGMNSQKALERIHQLTLQSAHQKEFLSRYLTIGEILYHEEMYDSANVYLSKVFFGDSNSSSKKQAAEWLVDICKAQGRDDEILGYASFLVPFANQEENQSAIKSQLTELYKTFVQYRLENLHQQARKRSQKRTLLIIGTLLSVVLITSFFLHKNKKRKQHLEAKIKEVQYAHDIQQRALSQRLRKSNETLREALKRIEEQIIEQDAITNVKHQEHSDEEQYNSFMETPVCQEILSRVQRLNSDKKRVLKTDSDVSEYHIYALSETQLLSLSKTVEAYFPELYASLKKHHPALNQKDWRFCLLYLMQLDKMSICVLLQESYHTCRRYTIKLEQAFHCKHGLSSFLLEQIGLV